MHALLQQAEGADHIGLDEFARRMYRPVDMTFGRKVDDCTRPVLREQRLISGRSPMSPRTNVTVIVL